MALILTRDPTRQDWDCHRTEILDHRRQDRTARWIAEQPGRDHGLGVSKKMVYDRLAEWKVPTKKKKKYPRAGRQVCVSRAMNTSPGEIHLTAALSSIGDFLDTLAYENQWSVSDAQKGTSFQRLVAGGLMAISSISYDSPASYTELYHIGEKAVNIVTSFKVAMPPRVLSVLLRLLMPNVSTDDNERAAVLTVKKMMCQISADVLGRSHPLPLLCSLTLGPDQASSFVRKFTAQLDNRLHERIKTSAPDFVAQEKIYTARALASFGHSNAADTVLASVADLREVKQLTTAEYHRTVGFAYSQRNTTHFNDQAMSCLHLALDNFANIGMANSDNAMYVHFNLASIYERYEDLESCALHLRLALAISESNGLSHGSIKFVRDIYEVYRRLGREEEMRDLRERYSGYFE